MTIDDARENFMSDVYNTLDFLPTNNEANRIIDSFDRVTSGLNQQPCEDCISRQAVEKMIKAEMPERGMWEIEGDTVKDTVCEVCADLMQKLSKLPSVTPKEKTGHWIKYSIPRCGEQHYQCTSCGYYINFGHWGEVYTKQFKYCPSCSAKMVEPQESEDNE